MEQPGVCVSVGVALNRLRRRQMLRSARRITVSGAMPGICRVGECKGQYILFRVQMASIWGATKDYRLDCELPRHDRPRSFSPSKLVSEREHPAGAGPTGCSPERAVQPRCLRSHIREEASAPPLLHAAAGLEAGADDDLDGGGTQIPHRVWTPPVTQAFSSVGLVHAVRHCRVSGLSMRQVPRRGPSWRCVDRVHDACACLMALRCEPVFPIPSRSTVCPCLSSDLPASPSATRPALSGGGSPAALLFRHQRPHDRRHPVGQRHGSFVLPRRAAQRTTAMAPVISSRLGSRWPIFDILPSRGLPPVVCWRGTRPRSPGRAGRSPSAAQRPEPPSR